MLQVLKIQRFIPEGNIPRFKGKTFLGANGGLHESMGKETGVTRYK